jgi:hypothetical protein
MAPTTTNHHLNTYDESLPVDDLVDAFNRVDPRIAERRRTGIGLACAISESQQWNEHERACEVFLATYCDAVELATRLGFAIDIDVMVDRDDLDESALYSSVSVSPSFMSFLGSRNVSLVLSHYFRSLPSDLDE